MGGICSTCQYADTFTGDPEVVTPAEVAAAVDETADRVAETLGWEAARDYVAARTGPCTCDACRVQDDDGEVRITDPVTGGQKGQKDARFGGMDAWAALELARVYGYGEGKYERFNYLKGYAWSLSIDALFRHLFAFLAGENADPESGLLHTAHVAWHAQTLTAFALRGLGTDDRYQQADTSEIVDSRPTYSDFCERWAVSPDSDPCSFVPSCADCSINGCTHHQALVR